MRKYPLGSCTLLENRLTTYFMAILMFAIPVITLEIFTVEMSMTLKFRMSRVKCKYSSLKPTCDFLFVGNCHRCSFYPIWHHLRDKYIRTSQWIWFEHLTLKMKINAISNLNENCWANLLKARAYVPISTSRGSTVCFRCISWWTCRRTSSHIDIASWDTPFNSAGMV